MFITLVGEDAALTQAKLENAADNFKKGRLDRFVVVARDLGDITSVVIEHDGKGLGSGWFLEKVYVFARCATPPPPPPSVSFVAQSCWPCGGRGRDGGSGTASLVWRSCLHCPRRRNGCGWKVFAVRLQRNDMDCYHASDPDRCILFCAPFAAVRNTAKKAPRSESGYFPAVGTQ